MTENERIINRVPDLLRAKEKRENRRIGYRVLASEAGVGDSTAQAWMTNALTRFDAAPMLAFCRYFGCEVGDLIQIERELACGQEKK